MVYFASKSDDVASKIATLRMVQVLSLVALISFVSCMVDGILEHAMKTGDQMRPWKRGYVTFVAKQQVNETRWRPVFQPELVFVLFCLKAATFTAL